MDGNEGLAAGKDEAGQQDGPTTIDFSALRCMASEESPDPSHDDPVWVNVQAEPAAASAATSGDAMQVQGADDSQANADAVLPIRQTAWQSMMRVIRNPASAGIVPPRGMDRLQPVARTALVQPPPPPPSDQPRRRKRQKTVDGYEGLAAGKDEAAKQDGPTMIDFYALRCMSSEESPDPRCVLESAIDALAAQLRADPTLPADADNGSVPSRAALREDAAVQLPAKPLRIRRLHVARQHGYGGPRARVQDPPGALEHCS